MEQNKTLATNLKISNFPFEITDNNGNEIYYEGFHGYWVKEEFNQNNERIYFEDSFANIRYNKSKTLAKQLKINNFSFEINDNNGNRIYLENCNGFWYKQEFNQYNQKIYYESSNGLIYDNKPKTLATQLKINKFPFHIIDDNENIIYYEFSDGFWYKREIDQNNKEIYFETSNGTIFDYKPKTR